MNYAIDRNALVRLYGGLATPTENILPPTYPQYKKHTLYPHERREGEAADPAGRRRRARRWRSGDRTARRRKKPVEYLTDVLNKIGLKAKLEDHRRVDLLDDDRQPEDEGADRVRGLVPGLPASARLVRRAAERRPDHRDAQQQLLELRQHGRQHEDRPALKQKPTLDDSVNAQWAALDKQVMQQAAWAPYVNRQFTDFFGSEIDTGCYINHVLYQFDFSRICMK